MTDREKVIWGLEACNRKSYNGSDCQNCPYHDDEDTAELPFGICNIQDMFDDALTLLKERDTHTVGVWHKWPDEKPEDYVDSTFPEGKGCWEITCLSLSRNGRIYLQKRSRFIDWDPGNCRWSHWPEHGSAGWWMFIPEPPKEEDDG